MNKFILGSVLAAISLLAIYGTSASNRVTSWVDGDSRTPGQALNDDDAAIVAVNSDEATPEPIIDISGRTPLQRAGDIPQRQVTDGIQSTPNFGQTQPADGTDDTGGGVITPDPQPAPEPAAEAPTTPQTPAQQTPAQTAPAPPVRALW